MNARDRRGAGWARAKAVLERALERGVPPGSRVQVGWITKVGDGLSREIFAAEVEVSRAGSTRRGTYAALLSHRDRQPAAVGPAGTGEVPAYCVS